MPVESKFQIAVSDTTDRLSRADAPELHGVYEAAQHQVDFLTRKVREGAAQLAKDKIQLAAWTGVASQARVALLDDPAPTGQDFELEDARPQPEAPSAP